MPEPNFVDKTIWTGDNLDILRGLNSESVDLIYLDPPFNSNRNYAAPVGSRARESNHPDNLQLPCPNCNRVKGDRDMVYLVARLGEGRGWGVVIDIPRRPAYQLW